MRDIIITRLGAAGAAGRIRPEEEGFLALPGGEVLTLLPGDTLPALPGARLIAVAVGAGCRVDAGAGGVPLPGGGALGGWASFRCELLSPRRFVTRHLEALLEGRDPEALLTLCLRGALESGFAACAGNRAALWGECRRRAADALLDAGWQLTGFRPMHLEPLPMEVSPCRTK